jgi:acetyltransferase-like isoleucine patch superfamily enzyme
METQSLIHGGVICWPSYMTLNVPIRNDGCGNIVFGENVTFGYPMAPRLGNGEILLQARGPNSQITIGRGTLMNNNITIVAMESVKIGESCQIGDMVAIMDSDFHDIDPIRRNLSHGKIQPVTIGSNVWLGSRVMVLKGVSIGDNSVVAAGSVVTKSLPANVVAAGIPARPVKKLSDA